MSKFWAAAAVSSSSSSSDSDDSSIISSSSNDLKKTENRWVMSDDSDSSDSVRVVKSAKDKTLASLMHSIRMIRNAMKIQDYAAVQENFDFLVKNMNTSKTKTILEAYGGVPRFFIRILVNVEDFFNNRKKDKVAFRKLSPRQGRSFNRMVLTLKKHNKKYEELINEYRLNPSNTNEESDDESSEVDDSEIPSDSTIDSSSNSESDSYSSSKKSSSLFSDIKESDDDVFENWSSSDSSSSSSCSDDQVYSELKGRSRWLKKSTVAKEKLVKDKEGRGKARAEARAAAAASKAASMVKEGDISITTKSILPEQALTTSLLNRKVKDIVVSRGKRGTDTKHVLRQLEAISRLSIKFGPKIEVPILIQVIIAHFDLVKNLDDVMEISSWRSCTAYLRRVVDILEGKTNYNSSTLSGNKPPKYKLSLTNDDDAFDLKVELGIGNKVSPRPVTPIEFYGTASIPDNDHKIKVSSSNVRKSEQPSPGTNLVESTLCKIEVHDDNIEDPLTVENTHAVDEPLFIIPVNGSLCLLLIRLEEEYTKSLQKISPHTDEYMLRLSDEPKLIYLLSTAQVYFQRIDMKSEAAVVASLRVEHLYYHHDSIAEQIFSNAKFSSLYGDVNMLHPACIFSSATHLMEEKKGNDVLVDKMCKSHHLIDININHIHPASVNERLFVPDHSNDHDNTFHESSSSEVLINDLCTYVYQNGKDRLRTRVMLCHIFHHALHNRFLEGRDLLLMSHLQDNISNVGDVSTMILFNRMMVVLGLAAFRLGRMRDAYQCLSDVCSGRVRELLAQGVTTGRYAGDRSAEQEKAEKRRQIPYHQHINLDLLEACHLISAMLLEVPNMACSHQLSDSLDTNIVVPISRRKVISRIFRKYYEIYDRQVFVGPPEQTREYVMRASKFLMRGEWKSCFELLSNLDVWQLVPGFDSYTKIKVMLLEKIKHEGLRTYIFAYSSQYDSLSIHVLCEMFDLSKNDVHSLVSKMIIHRELYASWDQPTETIVICRVEPTSLHLLAAQYTEKISNLVEANERLLDTKRGFGIRDFDGFIRSSNWKSCGDRDSQYMQKGGVSGGTKQHNHQSGPHGHNQRRFHYPNYQVGRGRGNSKGIEIRRNNNGSGINHIGSEISSYTRGNRLW